MNTLFGKTLVVTLTVLGSGLMPLAIARAVDSPITEEPTASPINSEESDPQIIAAEAEPLPESVVNGEKVSENSPNSLLPTPTNTEIATPVSGEKVSENSPNGLLPTPTNTEIATPVSGEKVSENSPNGLLPTPTNTEIATHKTADFSQQIGPNLETGSEATKENSLVSDPSPESTWTQQVIPVSGLTAELPQKDTSIEPAREKTPNPESSLLDRDTSVEPDLQNTLNPELSEDNTSSMDQVTSVSQLSDVKPTDWAFQALQSLVERYGCIAGYPDGTYRGNRAMTRYEFAAGLNACLDKVREVITGGTTNLATKEDLLAVQRLQEEFAAELATLRGRVDALEARTAELEANQFSTTTKLTGQVLTYLGDAFGKNASDANNTTLGYRLQLNLNSSFTGQDNLFVVLEAINLRPLNTATEFPQGRLSGPTDETRFLPSDISGNGSLNLIGLGYRFPVGDKLLVSLNAFSSNRLLSAPLSPFASPTTGALSYFGSINPILYPAIQQTGIGVQWKATPWLNFDFAAGSEFRTNDPSVGFSKAGYSGSIRTVFDFGPLDISLNYVHLYSPQFGVDTFSGSNAAQIQGAGAVVANAYLPGISYRVSRTLGLSGSVGLINARALGNGTKGDANVVDYRFSLAFYDLGKEGNLAGIVFGVQPRLTGTSNGAIARAIGLPAGQRKDRDLGFHIEAFYTHQLTDNITITPGIFWLTAPNHDDRNPDVVVGAIRTTFSF
ncbi:iron uptake porin [Microcoleus sp. F10-C6]|uniref:iron uptake porin n=1 Tax=unclassified Microcoleus TaxID=2642155 RepID=UPI002FD2054B